MSSDLSVIPLGELVSVKGGKRLPKGTSLQAIPTDHPYIRVRDMGQRYIPSEGLEYVPDDVFPKIQRYIVHENDVIISIVGTIGLVSLIDSRFHLASQTENAAKLTGLDATDAHYLYYYLNSSAGQAEIAKGTVGAVQPKLPLYNIEKIPVVWPSRRARLQIVNQLKGIDDKIQLNNQINQTLEQIAQAIFKSWFVDFEPVRAKVAVLKAGGSEQDALLAAMRAFSGKNEAALTRLEAEQPEQYAKLQATAALFPSAMQDSELGEIPEGWGVGSFKDLCSKVESGGTPKRKVPEYWNGDIKWLSSGEVRDVIALNTKEKITQAGLKNSAAKLWPEYTTVIAMYGATAGQVCLLADEMTSNQACCALLPKKNYKTFTFIAAKRSVESLAGKASGSAQQNLNKGLVENHRTILPPEEILISYEEVSLGLIEKWIENSKESLNLAELRDTLLPKLLSGELSLAEIEADEVVIA